MCYSAMVKEDLRRIEREFGEAIDWDAFVALYQQRSMDLSLKIPAGMERSLIDHGGAAGKAIKRCVDQFRAPSANVSKATYARFQHCKW